MPKPVPTPAPMDNVYELYQNGTRLLEDGDYHAAAVPLARARDLEPDKTSIREALGRALQLQGKHHEARKPLALASTLRPERADYRHYRDRARRASEAA